jgi:hypothetical protein
MNIQKNIQTQTQTNERQHSSLHAPDLSKLRQPVGSFAGSQDYVVRIRDGQFVAADTGDQGGGQN